MGGGGRADSTTGSTAGSTMDSASRSARSSSGWLFSAPGGGLAAAVEAAVDPVSGLVPAGFLPAGDSTDPWAQVIHTVVAARRLQGWLLWVQLSLLDRWAAAWRARPPGSDAFGEADRCESADPDLTERVNAEIAQIKRQFGGRFAPMWGADPQLPVQLVTSLVGAELGLAT